MADVGERLASLEANMRNIQSQAAENERQRQRTFEYMKEMKTDILSSIGNLDDKFTEKFADLDEKRIGPLWDDKNKRDGAFGLGKFIAGGIGGLIVAGMEWMVRK